MLLEFVVVAIVLDECDMLDGHAMLDLRDMLGESDMLDRCEMLDGPESGRVRRVRCEGVSMVACRSTTGAGIILGVKAGAVSGTFSMYSRITLHLVLPPSSVDFVSK